MTGAERLKAALEHREPDRVPFDLGGTEVSGISITALKRWLALQGWEGDEVQVFSLATQLGRIEEKHLQRLGVDVRCLRTLPPRSYAPDMREDGSYRFFSDEWGIRWRMPMRGGLYYDIAGYPLASLRSPQEVREYSWPDFSDPSRYDLLEAEARRIKAESGSGIVAERAAGGIFETSWWMRGFENLLMDLAADPPMALAVMEKVLELKLAYWDRVLERLKDIVEVLAEADDLATQQGLILSKEMYRKYLKPLHRKLFSFIKVKAPRMKLFFHSCGAIHDLIPDLIELGVDILNPVQVSAADMDTGRLKKEFGRDLVFWGGGVDTQKVLPRGTPQQVRDEVKRRIDDLAPGGGFVFAAVHCIQPDVPPENLQAMWEALQEYGGN